jgi:drug/metabolite transporter (DMT)-like permease
MLSIKFSRSNSILLLAAAIWGFAFVAQKAGMEYVGPFTFNGIRYAMGSLALLPFIKLVKIRFNESNYYSNKQLFTGGALAGLILFAGASFQQVGIVSTTAGNAGFITCLYVIMVPIFGFFWKHTTNLQTWIGAFLATIGLYFLSVTERLSLSPGDGIVLISAVFFAFHVLVIGRISPRVDPIKISIIQFTVCAFLSFIIAALTEEITWFGIRGAALPLLYGGVLSIGVAFTLQIIGQRKAKPAHAAIILSFESLFAAVGGWLILSEGYSARGLTGCGLMLMGLVISQVKISRRRRN